MSQTEAGKTQEAYIVFKVKNPLPGCEGALAWRGKDAFNSKEHPDLEIVLETQDMQQAIDTCTDAFKKTTAYNLGLGLHILAEMYESRAKQTF